MKKMNLPKKHLPKSQKNLSRKEKLLPVIPSFKINQPKNKLNPSKKIHPKNISSMVMISKDLKKRQKKLGATSLDYSQRKNNKYMVEYDNKKIHFGSANAEDFITHKDPDRRDKYLSKAKKISDKDGHLTHLLPSYPNYWSIKLLN